MMYCLGVKYIYIETTPWKPERRGLCQKLVVRSPGGWSDHQGQRRRETLVNSSRHLGDIPNGSGQASHRRWSRNHVTIIQHIFNTPIVETLATTNIETGPKL
jgi:hypothetical protein